MKAIIAKRVFMIVIAVFSMSFIVGCTSMERRPEYRSHKYLYYPTALVEADRTLDEARVAGKDKECPNEFNAQKKRVDEAYDVYISCHTKEAIDMANEAIGKIKALCPARPKAEMKPEPKHEMKPVPKAEPQVVQKVIVLEDVYFDLNKSILTKDAQKTLRRNIRVLKENPNLRIRLEGNTSAIGTGGYNQKLSDRRAKAVYEFLIKEGEISPYRLSTIGYGKTRMEMPEPNPKIVESPAAKTNRRVTFKIIEN